MLEIRDLDASYGDTQVLRGISLEVREGEVVTLIGRNGAGKSTTMKSIMGDIPRRSGSITFKGQEIIALGSERICKLGIGYVPEDRGMFGTLSVLENLTIAKPQNTTAWPLERIFGLFPAMEKFWSLAAGSLSGGQKQMLSISRAIIEPRKLLLIDEPTKGLAPAIIMNMISAFKELKQTGATILLVEQNFSAAKLLGDQVAVMDDGRIVHRGAMAELAEDTGLQQKLLGLSMDAHQ